MKKEIFTTAAFLNIYTPAILAKLIEDKREFKVKHNDRFVEFIVYGVQAPIEAFENLNHLIAYHYNIKP